MPRVNRETDFLKNRAHPTSRPSVVSAAGVWNTIMHNLGLHGNEVERIPFPWEDRVRPGGSFGAGGASGGWNQDGLRPVKVRPSQSSPEKDWPLWSFGSKTTPCIVRLCQDAATEPPDGYTLISGVNTWRNSGTFTTDCGPVIWGAWECLPNGTTPPTADPPWIQNTGEVIYRMAWAAAPEDFLPCPTGFTSWTGFPIERWDRNCLLPPTPYPAGGVALDELRDPNKERAGPRPRDSREETQPERKERPKKKKESQREWIIPLVPFAVVPPPLAGTTPRRPPRRGEKEKKVRSKLSALFKFLDTISEGAEVVDAIFESLPCELQKKHMDKCRKAQPFLDSAGQYGIDRADCKAKAIWKEWEHVDAPLAVANIIRNEIQDQAIGAIHRAGSKASPMAVDASLGRGYDGRTAGGKKLNQLIDSLVGAISDEAGLPPPRDCKGK